MPTAIQIILYLCATAPVFSSLQLVSNAVENLWFLSSLFSLADLNARPKRLHTHRLKNLECQPLRAAIPLIEASFVLYS
jgi:hypothetical protein